MPPLSHCTLTGVDDATPLHAIEELSAVYPIVEWGFLYSPSQRGKGGRYPSVPTIHGALRDLKPNVRVALHVCGRGVPDLLYGGEDPVIANLVEMLSARGGRLQLNFSMADGRVRFGALADFIDKHPRLTVITQHNQANSEVVHALAGRPNHAVLFDGSGGRGISPEGWPAPLSNVRCGYAGGLGPDNLEAELERISTAVGDTAIWIDMEGKLRDQQGGRDAFNLTLAERCLTVVSQHCTRKNRRRAPLALAA